MPYVPLGIKKTKKKKNRFLSNYEMYIYIIRMSYAKVFINNMLVKKLLDISIFIEFYILLNS